MRSLKVLSVIVLLMGAASAVNATDYLAVAYDGGGGSVGVYNLATGTLVSNPVLPGGGSSGSVQFTPDGSLYVSRYQDPGVLETSWDLSKYSVSDWSLQQQWAFASHMTAGMAYAADGSLYVGNVGGGVYKLGLGTNITPTYMGGIIGGDLREMAADAKGNVYAACSGPRKIGIYDTNASTQLPYVQMRTINDLPAYPVSVALGPDRTGDGKSDLYVGYWAIASGQSTIDIYDGQTGAFSGVFDNLANYNQDGCAITSIVFSADGTTAYFTSWQSGTVFKKVGDNAATAFITGVSGTRGIALTNEYTGVVPEPGSLAALCTGLLAMVGAGLRRRR